MDYPLYPTEIKLSSGQTFGPGFGLINAKGDGIAWNISSCKEYMLDYMYNTINAAVGLNYDVCLDEVRIISGHYDPTKALDLLNQFEDHLKIPRSVAFRLSNKEPGASISFVFRGSPRWIAAPPMLSLYSLIIRSGAKSHNVGTPFADTINGFIKINYDNWRNYYKLGLDVLLSNGDEAVFGTDMKKNWAATIQIHMFGFGSFSSGLLQKSRPEWYSKFKEVPMPDLSTFYTNKLL